MANSEKFDGRDVCCNSRGTVIMFRALVAGSGALLSPDPNGFRSVGRDFGPFRVPADIRFRFRFISFHEWRPGPYRNTTATRAYIVCTRSRITISDVSKTRVSDAPIFGRFVSGRRVCSAQRARFGRLSAHQQRSNRDVETGGLRRTHRLNAARPPGTRSIGRVHIRQYVSNVFGASRNITTAYGFRQIEPAIWFSVFVSPPRSSFLLLFIKLFRRNITVNNDKQF